MHLSVTQIEGAAGGGNAQPVPGEGSGQMTQGRHIVSPLVNAADDRSLLVVHFTPRTVVGAADQNEIPPFQIWKRGQKRAPNRLFDGGEARHCVHRMGALPFRLRMIDIAQSLPHPFDGRVRYGVQPIPNPEFVLQVPAHVGVFLSYRVRSLSSHAALRIILLPLRRPIRVLVAAGKI